MRDLIERLGWDRDMEWGFSLSVLLHFALVLVPIALAALGLIFSPDIEMAPAGIKAEFVSNLNASPKIPEAKDKKEPVKAREAEKPKPQPKPEPVAKPAPKPEPEKQAVQIPEKPKEEKKKEEVKKEEKKVEKKEEKKQEKKKPEPDLDEAMRKVLDSTLEDRTPDTPAEQTQEKPKEQPQLASVPDAPPAQNYSEVPLSMGEMNGIADQIRPNWAVDPGALTNPADYIAWLRVYFDPSGAVQRVEFLEPGRMGDPRYQMVAESCRRAFMITNQITFPSGKYYPVIRFACDPTYIY